MNAQSYSKQAILIVLALLVPVAIFIAASPTETVKRSDQGKAVSEINSLKPPTKGDIPVAFVISEGAVIIDFCGPWEVFRDVMVPGRQDHPFRLYTVAETIALIRAGGGMKIVPDYTIANAPAPQGHCHPGSK